ncbi:MAG TPA: protein kinase [Vicinamibacterales bacterium]|nr:protein kinase [Vicinamibacterales bacterium]
MALVPGTRLGSYEIVAALGAGGMGEVYRATDTKLKRQVAIKILPSSLAADADRLARFQREAEVLASLNHPHIAAVYGLETTDGGTALVMELVAGEDLSERIARGPVPVDEALSTARQIADALEAAHDQGIIHRDLKPANIKVRADGTVKVLDFGLAKAMAPAGSSPDVSPSPTITTPAMMTGAGVILGTAAYMSPEQARGKVAGKRADIWAFGCVLYELLAGRRVFEADEVADVLARVLTLQPDWSLLPPTVPAGIQRLLSRCLEKDPKRRLADIADARLEIDDALAEQNGKDTRVAAGAPRAVGSSGRTKAAWAVAALFAASALGLGIAMMRRPVVAEAPVYRSTILVNETLSRRAPSHRFRLSPDGRQLAYIAADASGRTMLWVRPLDSLAGQPLAGTDDANAPFWSPDSRFVAFFADAKLKRIDAAGGPVTVICDAPASTGRRLTTGSWNRQDVIVIPSPDSPTIARVAASGGTPSAVTILEANGEATQHGSPFFLPDGQRFLYVAYRGLVPLGMYVGSLAGEPPVRLMDTGSNGQYANGSLLFVRGTTLMAQRFDPTTLALSGEAVAIGDRVGMNISFMRAGAFSVSETGALVYQGYGEGQTARLVWSDRNGNQTPVLDERLPYRDLRLSPDGLRAAVSVANSRDNMSDVWIVNPVRGLRTRFTFDAADEFSPIWSANGAEIAFSSRRKGHLDLYRKTASGADREDVLLNDAVDKTPTSWSPDGKLVLYSIDGAMTGPDVWVLPLAGDRKPFPFLASNTDERFAQFSPDGRWVAYAASESGRVEVYVASFPGPGGKQLISSAGGSYPRWRPDGKELFYQSPDNRLMAATVRLDEARVDVDAVRPLFEMRAPDGSPRNFYDVASNGQRFMVVVPDETAATPLTLVNNWPTVVKNGR